MKNLSVKVKVLSVLITLTVVSLSIFAYLTFQSYKQDKMAFVYDSLANETQSKSKLLSTTVASYDLFLGSIISGLDFTTRVLPASHTKYLKQKVNISGLYFHIPGDANLEKVTLFEGTMTVPEHIWGHLTAAPLGLSLIDGDKGLFHLKKALSGPGSFSSLVFRQVELSGLIDSSNGRHSLLLNIKSTSKAPENAFSNEGMKTLKDKIKHIQMPFGLFESEFEGENYLVSFSKLSMQDLILVNMVQEKKMMLIQDMLLKQIVLFLTLITSISLLIGTLGTRWLTYHVDILTDAAREMENENFDVHVDIEGKDELGVLGSAFNNMGEKIKSLLEELKRYNLELEQRVLERTRELQGLTDIQKGMLNSLGQGFVIIDKDHKIKPIYSKVAEEMFEVVPDKSSPGEIMAVKPEEVANFKELFGLTFMQMLDFDDMAKLNPEMRTNSKHQQISLNYAPIKNGEDGTLDYVLVIGTDKTAEIESMEKFKKEWNFSQMIMKIASNRFSLNKVISESLGMLKTCVEVVEKDKEYALRDVQRLVHTVKGSFSYFHIDELTQMSHDFETYLAQYYDVKLCPVDVKLPVLEKVFAIQVAIECYIDHYDSIVQYKDSTSHKSIAVKDLNQFASMLKTKSIELAAEFKQRFFKTKVTPFFQIYPGVVKDLSLALNKEARFLMDGGDLELPDGPWDELFVQFIHVVRNSMAHGMEFPQEREEAGKPREGLIIFKFETEGDLLKITLSDDGKGIDWEKMAQKDSAITCEADAIARILTGGLSSQDEVSEVSGRGVGVSSVYATVMNRGGKMVVENNFKKGMSIIIHVPLSKEKEERWSHSA